MRYKDIEGQEFGQPTVIKKSSRKAKGHGAYWICKCECGRYLVVRSDNLRNSRSTQCSACRNNAGRLSIFIERGEELG